MSIYIDEKWVAYDDRYPNGVITGEMSVYESRYDTVGTLFRGLQEDYGRCSSKVYHDDYGAIGWVFEKRMAYEDTGEPYKQEVWVTLHEKEPTRTVEYHYLGLEESR